MNVSGERTRSLWMQEEVAPDAPRLTGKLRCDTVVVGSGIAGLSTAYELAQAGRIVIVVDRGPIAGGMTSRTTAHLSSICDDGTSTLAKMRGEEVARLFHESHAAAIDRIETIVESHKISCNFRRLKGLLFPALGMDPKDAREQQNEEYDIGRKLGIAVEKRKGVPLRGFEDAPVLRYGDQGAFHPLKYLKGVAAAVTEKGGLMFANSAVVKIEELEASVRLTTEGGGVVEAARAVFATNSPINDWVEIHSKMGPYRTYAMAFTIPRGSLPDALYWDMAGPYHYVRLSPGPGTTDYLITGGHDHKSGEADDGEARFEALEAWTRSLLPDLGKEVHRWSGQVMETIDSCGFIGRNPGSENVYIATGDSGQGITHGALAGLLLRDLILRGSSPWAEVYDPARKTPTGVLNYISENTTTIQNFAKFLMPGEISSPEELKPGEGGVLRQGTSMIAACRDLDGKLHLNSATCTHLGCMVQWNSTEQCWDCPCHGSQFAPDGAVLNAPAISPLEPADADAKRTDKAKADT